VSPSAWGHLAGFISGHLGLDPTKENMNPVDYWYNTNDEFREFIAEYFNEKKSIILENLLISDCSFLFEEFDTELKLQVISFLSGVNTIYSQKIIQYE
jgi:asparagine synthase (glutamine-hydrolysing)